MLHFPDSFPVDALQVIGPIVRSGGVIPDKVEAGEAALTLLGYGMGLWLGTEPTNVVGASGPLALDVPTPLHVAEAALDELEHATPGRMKAGTVGAIGGVQLAMWAIELAKFVIPLLLKR